MKKNGTDPVLKQSTKQVLLDCESYRDFWLYWEHGSGLLAFGTGKQVCHNESLSYTLPTSDIFDVGYVAVTMGECPDGEWMFDAQCPGDREWETWRVLYKLSYGIPENSLVKRYCLVTMANRNVALRNCLLSVDNRNVSSRLLVTVGNRKVALRVLPDINKPRKEALRALCCGGS